MADNTNAQTGNTGGTQTSGDDVLLNEEQLLGLGAPKPTKAKTAGTAQASDAGGIPQTKTQLVQAASRFNIPMVVRKKYPSLVPLILQTESMDDEEREYWFQILPIMTTLQIKQFRDILISEKQQLKKLDDEYEKELAAINDKHITEWQEYEVKAKKQELEQVETANEEEESALEEDLLSKLQDL